MPEPSNNPRKLAESADQQVRLGRRSSGWLFVLVGILLVIGLGVAAVIATNTLRGTIAPAAVPETTRFAQAPAVDQLAPAYQVYFTTPRYPDDPQQRTSSLDRRLSEWINTARSTLDVCIYDLNLDNVTNALIAAKNRGVTVRLVAESDNLGNAVISRIKATGIPVVDDKRAASMHNQFVVLDDQAVWSGSWSFTTFDTFRYNNYATAIQSPELAHNYTAKFNQMFNERKFGTQRSSGNITPSLLINRTPLENYFAPEDKVAAKIIARIGQAQRSIVFLAFSFTDDDIAQVVRLRAQRGVSVRGVFETTGSETQFSEYNNFKSLRLDVLTDGNPYFMNENVFVLDEKTVILTSFAFSKDAEGDNDGNMLILDDPVVARTFLDEFARVYATAQSPPQR